MSGSVIKEDMEQYWSQRAEQFSALRQREFSNIKHEQWLAELNRYIPKEKRLNILDIGTGSGFFAFLLAEQGHRLTGIDLSPRMIDKAKKFADELGLSIDFFVMDAERPYFAPQSFDLIVTRRLTWALPNLLAAYQAWHELLKPGGMLLNFDADYCHKQPCTKNLPCHAHKDITAELMREYERIRQQLQELQQLRPHWDLELLSQAGFSNITLDESVWQRVYTTIDEFYDPTPGFAISAIA